MAGYIGKSQGVTQVDGYNRTEADGRYVNASGDTMTGSLGVNVSPASPLHVKAIGSGWSDHVTLEDVGSTKWNILVDQGDSGRLRIRNQNNDINALNINTSGMVNIPHQPAFMATPSEGGGTGVSAGEEIAKFNQAPLNVGNCYNTSTYTFTAPVSGVYGFRAVILSSANTRLYYHFRINDVAVYGTFIETYAGTQYQSATSTMTCSLQANDTVTVYCPTTAYGGPYSNWSGHLIG